MVKSARGAALVAALTMAGCGVHIGDGHNGAGPLRTSSETVARDKAKGAEMIRAEISMGAGEMDISGGAKELFEGSFEYNSDSFKPQVRFEGGGFRGRLSVEQTKGSEMVGQVRNRWRMKLAGDLPLDLMVRCGAGENRLDLRELTLRGVEMHFGVGEVDVDLRNKPTKSYSVKIYGGIGQATVIVPAGVGVEAEASGGIGEINVRGMNKDGSRWINEAYDPSKPVIRLEVKGGIGQIDIRTES